MLPEGIRIIDSNNHKGVGGVSVGSYETKAYYIETMRVNTSWKFAVHNNTKQMTSEN